MTSRPNPLRALWLRIKGHRDPQTEQDRNRVDAALDRIEQTTEKQKHSLVDIELSLMTQRRNRGRNE